jgi:YVTN family beta-propeller protein
VGTAPVGVAFDGTNIWVANYGGTTVSKINVSTNTVTATVSVGASPIGVAFDGTNIWVANYSSNNVSKINAKTNGVFA